MGGEPTTTQICSSWVLNRRGERSFGAVQAYIYRGVKKTAKQSELINPVNTIQHNFSFVIIIIDVM